MLRPDFKYSCTQPLPMVQKPFLQLSSSLHSSLRVSLLALAKVHAIQSSGHQSLST